MGSLGMTRAVFAKCISVPEKTLDKWLAPSETTDFRNMPEVVWAYVREILVWEAKSARYTPIGGMPLNLFGTVRKRLASYETISSTCLPPGGNSARGGIPSRPKRSSFWL